MTDIPRMFGQPGPTLEMQEALIVALERRLADERGYAEAARNEKDKARYLRQAAEVEVMLREVRGRLGGARG